MYRETIRKALEAKRAEAQTKWTEFDEARKAIQAEGFDPTKDKDAFEKAHELQKAYALIAEGEGGVRDLTAQYEKALDIDGAPKPDNTPFTPEGEAGTKAWQSPGDRVLASENYKGLRDSGVLNMQQGRINMNPVKAMERDEYVDFLKSGISPMGMKTLLTAQGAPGTTLLQTQRLPGIMPLLQAPITVTGLVTVGATDSNVIEWVKMLAITNNAAEVAEATATSGASGMKPESGFTFTTDSTVVQTIAHWIPATRQALSDMPQLRTLIDEVLVDGVRRRLDSELLRGDGISPNLRGILNTSGILTTSGSGMPTVEAVLRAMTAIRLQFFEPTAILMHPNDWMSVRLSTDANGVYIYGPPSQPGNPVMWGVPIIQDTAATENTAVVAQWNQAILYVREGVTVTATDSHSDFFVRNMVAVLAEGRYGVAVPRPQAFCTVTGI